jgi:hypothetical protein
MSNLVHRLTVVRLPTLVTAAGERASMRFLEFFATTTRGGRGK